jgi:hypothetical protein
VIFTYVLTIYLRFMPSIILPPLFLDQFQQVSFFYFHLQVQNKPSFTLFLCPPHLPLVPTPDKDLFHPPVLHFFKCILIVHGGFASEFQACIYSALIRLPLPLLTLYHRAPLLFNSLQCIVIFYSYIDEMLQYF